LPKDVIKRTNSTQSYQAGLTTLNGWTNSVRMGEAVSRRELSKGNCLSPILERSTWKVFIELLITISSTQQMLWNTETCCGRQFYVIARLRIGNESVSIQLAQCWFPRLAISNAKIKYKYFSRGKYTEAILSNSTQKLLWLKIIKMLIVLQICSKINFLCYLLQFSAHFRSLLC